MAGLTLLFISMSGAVGRIFYLIPVFPGETRALHLAPDMEARQDVVLRVLDLGDQRLTQWHNGALGPANLGSNPEQILATEFCIDLKTALLGRVEKEPGLCVLEKQG